jgi:hypothetical protein
VSGGAYCVYSLLLFLGWCSVAWLKLGVEMRWRFWHECFWCAVCDALSALHGYMFVMLLYLHVYHAYERKGCAERRRGDSCGECEI